MTPQKKGGIILEYTFSQLSDIAKNLRERYPIGTRIKLLSMGDDPNPIPPGTKGTVEGIDDIATVFCRFDNGRSLGLAYGEDRYRALTQAELLEEKCQRNYDKYYDAVHRDIFADVDLDRFSEECVSGNDAYITEILGQLHDKFAEIYGTDDLNGLVGYVQVPAIVESEMTGNYYPALVTLDLESSGEHCGTCVLSYFGAVEQGDCELGEDENQFLKDLIPYRYWYTVNCDRDIHVNMAECPEHIRDIIANAAGQALEQNGGMSL